MCLLHSLEVGDGKEEGMILTSAVFGHSLSGGVVTL